MLCLSIDRIKVAESPAGIGIYHGDIGIGKISFRLCIGIRGTYGKSYIIIIGIRETKIPGDIFIISGDIAASCCGIISSAIYIENIDISARCIKMLLDKIICKAGTIISCVPEFWLALVLIPVLCCCIV